MRFIRNKTIHKKVDSEILQSLKKWMSLLLWDSNEVLHIPYRQGLPTSLTWESCDIVILTHAFCLLTCPSELVSSIGTNTLRETTKRRISRPPSSDDLAMFPSRLQRDQFSQDSRNFASLWPHACNATHHFRKHISCHWTPCK